MNIKIGRDLLCLVLFFVLLPALMPRAHAQTVEFVINTSIGCTDLTYEGYDVTVNGCTLTIDCTHDFNSLSVINGGTIRHTAGGTIVPPGEEPVGVSLTIATDMSVDAGSQIDLMGRGHNLNSGPGAPIEIHGGAGHGGRGGSPGNGGPTYDSLTNPVEMGSGANTARGGGAIQLQVNSTFTLDGLLTVDGGINNQAGGAGGSIQIQAGTLSGTGEMTANGGIGMNHQSYGGGGGGRIAVYAAVNDFTGQYSAFGGPCDQGSHHGGAGTVYLEFDDTPDTPITIDNNGYAGHGTDFAGITLIDGDLTIQNGAWVNLDPITTVNGNCYLLSIGRASTLVGTPLQLSVSGDMTVSSDSSIDLTGKGYATSSGPGAPTEGHGGAGHGGRGGRIGSGGPTYDTLTNPVEMGSGSSRCRGGGAIELNVSGIFTLDGLVTVDGQTNAQAGGAGGSILIQTTTLSGTGSIAAKGGNAVESSYGGGGGGRIAVYASINGFSGQYSAFGGQAVDSNHGGAGTVYLDFDDSPDTPITFDNNGNSGNQTDLAGTTVIDGDLTIQNGAWVNLDPTTTVNGSGYLLSNGKANTLTGSPLQLTVSGDMTVSSDSSIDLIGKGFATSSGPGAPIEGHGGAGHGGRGGRVGSGGLTYDTLTNPAEMGSGSSRCRGGGAIDLDVSGIFTLDGLLTVDGQTNAQAGGAGGSILIQTTTMSGTGLIGANGGNAVESSYGGGGGGRIAVYASINDFSGQYTAFGGQAVDSSHGGAGTVYLDFDDAQEAQILLNNNGYKASNITEFGEPFIWTLTDFSVLGGANLYLEDDLHIVNNLTLDTNSGITGDPIVLFIGNDLNMDGAFLSGGYHDLDVSGTATIENGASFVFSGLDMTVAGDILSGSTTLSGDDIKLYAGGSLSLDSGSMTVTTTDFTIGGDFLFDNSTLTGSRVAWDVTGNCAITAGSLIDLDGGGYPGGEGPGAGTGGYCGGGWWGGGGGGYGGQGGSYCNNDPQGSGPTYGSETQPIHFGSGGHGSVSSGGGAIDLFVGGTLTFDGAISSDGVDITEYGATGAGSGGSVLIQSYQLTGAGTISASGGVALHGSYVDNGSGGGGRVAIYSDDMSGFDVGNIQALGGIGGDFDGQDGTIFVADEVMPFVRYHSLPDYWPVDFIDVHFSRAINGNSFTAADIVLINPFGVEVSLSGPPVNQGNNIWRLSFPPQTEISTYQLYVGPYIADMGGNWLDQNRDGTPGEIPDDIYYALTTFGMSTCEITDVVADTPVAESRFGSSVAVSGSSVIYGAPGDYGHGEPTISGEAILYERAGHLFNQQSILAPTDTIIGDGFGTSVDIDGDYAVVGAPGADVGGVLSGAVYVFMWSGSEWLEQAKLVASDGMEHDRFGWTVSIVGDSILVGADYALGGAGQTSGAAYFFERSDTIWTETEKLTVDDGNRFGHDVALNGTVALIGAPDTGSAYIFEKSGGSWSQSAKLEASDSAREGGFGTQVDLDGNRAVVSQSQSYGGSVYVFQKSGSLWTEVQILTASDGMGGDGFSVVDIEGDFILVGAPGVDEHPFTNKGAAYIFKLFDTNWQEMRKFDLFVGETQGFYGESVALDGDYAYVGAPGMDTDYVIESGSGHVYGIADHVCFQTAAAWMSCVPSSGIVPFTTNMTVTLVNLYEDQTRQMAARIDTDLGNGQHVSNWRSGYSNLSPGEIKTFSWNQTIPAIGKVIGDNLFQLFAQDVTPPPYNEPPYPPSGDTDTAGCTVTAYAP